MSVRNIEFKGDIVGSDTFGSRISNPHRRVEYAGGFKMHDHKLSYQRTSQMPTHLDKDTIYSRLGYNFTTDQQQSTSSKVESLEDYMVTTNRRQVHQCKFAPTYQCNVHDGTMKLEQTSTVAPIIPRTNKQYPHGGDVVCFYYEANDAKNGNVVVINHSSREQARQIAPQRTHKLSTYSNKREQQKLVVPVKVNKLEQEKKHDKKKSSKTVVHNAPSPSEVLQYKQRYKQYIANKRDRHYFSILGQIIEKLDFERFQCTSPNDERHHSEWKGKFRPRGLSSMVDLTDFYKQSDEGLVELRKYLYLFLCQGSYDLKAPYEVTANLFIDGFRKYMQEKKELSKNLNKALNKLNFRKTHELLKEKISIQSLLQFLNQMRFILMVLRCHPNILKSSADRNLQNLQINYEQYEALIEKAVEEAKHSQKKEQVAKSQELQKQSLDRLKSKTLIVEKPLFQTDEQIDKMPISIIPHSLLASDHQDKKLTIREIKLQEDERHRQAEQAQILHYQFKAKQIPKAVRDKTLYQSMLKTQQEKRIINKQESKNRIKLIEKPFSFYNRHDEKKVINNQDPKLKILFRASSVPNLSKVSVYDKMLEQQQRAREMNLKARQEKLLRVSHYPQSMRNLANYKADKQHKLQGFQRQLYNTLNTNISYYRPIPKFDKLHRQQMQSLERRKHNFTATQPRQFHLSSARPMNMNTMISNFMPLSGFGESHVHNASPKSKPYHPPVPKYVSASTLKFDSMVAKRREKQQKVEAERMRVEHIQASKKRREQQHKNEILHRLADNLSVRQPISKEINYRNNETWSSKKEKIIQKVYEQEPLLIQRHYSRKDGKKVEEIVSPPQPTDKFQTII